MNEIDRFLKAFHEKKRIWQIVFRDDRGKNTLTLSILEIIPKTREKIIDSLTRKDYSEGPLEEKLHGGSEMWVFGKEVKGQEVYIKISMGNESLPVLCISFHIAQHPMNYPLK